MKIIIVATPYKRSEQLVRQITKRLPNYRVVRITAHKELNPKFLQLFNPNWFVDISHILHLKLQALQAYQSELKLFPHPRSIKAVEALAQWRGATVGVQAAEGFVLGRKLV